MTSKNIKIFLVIILSSLTLASLFMIHNDSNEERGISALDGLNVANERAREWNPDASLVYVTGMGKIYSNGKCDKWRYTYSDNAPDINISKGFEIVVFWNGSYEEREIDHPPATHEIDKWNIDSTKALEIAKSSGHIRTYLEKHDDAYIESIVLTANESGCAWSISWMSWGFLDNPQTAVINIDATTGEVLYVEADLSDGSSYLICFVPVVIIISILLVISLSMSKRFPNFFTATGFALFLIPTLYLRIYYSTSIFTFMTLVFAAVLWLGTKRRMSSTDLNMEHKQVYGLFGLLAADYFGLLIARFLLIPYSYPNLLWSSLLIINGAILYIILSLTSEEEGTGKILKFFNK